MNKYLILISFCILVGCNSGDYTDVELSGTVLYEGRGVPAFKLYVTNYYYSDGDQVGYMTATPDTVVTDKYGKFNINYKLSSYIQFDTVLVGTSDFYKEIYISNKNPKVVFRLDTEF